MKFFSSLALLAQASSVLALSAAGWRGQIIYQLLTDRFARPDGSTTATCNTGDGKYCGGTWQGIINKLDYIQSMGFTAIWISPVTQQIGSSGYGDPYHGYWQNNLNALNSHFGSASDLKALSSALHSRGMYLMVDVVVNHFAWPGSASSVDYSTYVPFNSSTYFHPYCTISQSDYDAHDSNVQNCWLGDSTVELTDLDTTRQDVINDYYTWISNLVSTYSIDGIRIDTAKHVQTGFWPGFNTAAGVYCIGEVADGDPNYAYPFLNYLDGILNYPLYYPLLRAFDSTSGSMSDLVNMVNTAKASKDSTLLGTFIENHDQPRFASITSDMAQAKNVLAFTLLHDGIPIVYAGQEQHYAGGNDPYNREATWLSGYSTSGPLYALTGTLNALRKNAIKQDSGYLGYQAWPIYSDTTTIAMRKGSDGYQVIAVLSNKGSSGASYTQVIPNTGYTQGQSLLEVVSCTTATAGASGGITVAMGQGAPKIYYPADKLSGSGVCGR